MNEQETNRNAILCTWFNEQSARELYLKPFEYCVKNTPSGKHGTNFTQWGQAVRPAKGM